MTGKCNCDLIKCRDVYCHNGMHYFEKHNNITYIYETKNHLEIIEELENKSNDYNICDICLRIWDMNIRIKVKDVDNITDTCNQCNMINHLNEKTMELIGECSICLKNMYKNTSMTTECNHSFHIICLQEWTNTINNCPLCRCVIN